MDSNLFRKPKVNLIGALQSSEYEGYGPEEIAVYGALGCFEERSPLELFLEDKAKLPKDKFEKKKARIFRETSGRGHGSVLDQNRFTFVIEDVPRIVTLQLCLPQYLEHLQQSLRRANADRGFFVPDAIKDSRLFDEVVTLLNQSFLFYEEMKEEGIPGEDARYVLPLNTRTNIQTTGDARELTHLHDMSRRPGVPSIVRETIEEMMSKLTDVVPRLFEERERSYEVLAWYPSAQLFSTENKTLERIIINGKGSYNVNLLSSVDFPMNEEEIKKAIKERDEAELANLKHTHYTFLTMMSLASFHQAIRQRTWDQSVQSIYGALKVGEFKIPPSIEKDRRFKAAYEDLNREMLELHNRLIERGVPQEEAVGVVPHSLKVFDLIHVNGWNALHSIGKRTCTEAQWEIRSIARDMRDRIRTINPSLGKYINPQGVLYGKCPERKSCGLCEKILEGEK